MASSTRVFGRCCRALMAAAKSSVADFTTATKTTSKATAAPRKIAYILRKRSPISPSLKEFIGASEASRTEAVKKVWDYIKLNNLQNPANKKVIYCDEKLKTIFDGKDEVGFLEITKLLSKHFVKTSCNAIDS